MKYRGWLYVAAGTGLLVSGVEFNLFFRFVHCAVVAFGGYLIGKQVRENQ